MTALPVTFQFERPTLLFARPTCFVPSSSHQSVLVSLPSSFLPTSAITSTAHVYHKSLTAFLRINPKFPLTAAALRVIHEVIPTPAAEHTPTRKHANRLCFIGENGAPGGIRTPDLLVRGRKRRTTANNTSRQEPTKSANHANDFLFVLDCFVPSSRTITRTISARAFAFAWTIRGGSSNFDETEMLDDSPNGGVLQPYGKPLVEQRSGDR
jgi:hypothetical protein